MSGTSETTHLRCKKKCKLWRYRSISDKRGLSEKRRLHKLTFFLTLQGCNGKSPRSPTGKMLAMFLTVLGIPLLFVYLAVVGSGLAKMFGALYAKVSKCCQRSPTNTLKQRRRQREGKAATPRRFQSGGSVGPEDLPPVDLHGQLDGVRVRMQAFF